jgi:hypothetical protein
VEVDAAVDGVIVVRLVLVPGLRVIVCRLEGFAFVLRCQGVVDNIAEAFVVLVG